MARLRGSCLCGRCRYSVEDDFEYAMNCHCSLCRRAVGAAFKSFGGIRMDALRLEANGQDVLRYGDEAAFDVRCRVCGSLLFSSVRDHAYAHVTFGTLLDAPGLAPTMHVFVGSKATWHEIRDELPQFDELPPDDSV